RMVVAAGTREQPEPRLALTPAQSDLAQNGAAPRPLDPSAGKVEVRGPGTANLSSPDGPARAPAAAGESQLLDKSANSAEVLARRVHAEVARQQSLAHQMREKEPKQALELLQRTR